MQLNLTPEWYKRAAELEEGMCVTAGGTTESFLAEVEANKETNKMEEFEPLAEEEIAKCKIVIEETGLDQKWDIKLTPDYQRMIVRCGYYHGKLVEFKGNKRSNHFAHGSYICNFQPRNMLRLLTEIEYSRRVIALMEKGWKICIDNERYKAIHMDENKFVIFHDKIPALHQKAYYPSKETAWIAVINHLPTGD